MASTEDYNLNVLYGCLDLNMASYEVLECQLLILY